MSILQSALARGQRGEFQLQAAVAALHADAATPEETDWVQIVEWYDELVALTDSPVIRLNRAVAVGEADGAPAGLAALRGIDPDLPRHRAVSAYLHEKAGDVELAADLRVGASAEPSTVESAHLLSKPADSTGIASANQPTRPLFRRQMRRLGW